MSKIIQQEYREMVKRLLHKKHFLSKLCTLLLILTMVIPVPAFASTPAYNFVASWPQPLTNDWYFINPQGIATDSSDNVYVADTDNNRVVKLDSSGKVLINLDNFGTGDGQFSHPAAIAVDTSANFYVADTNNNRIEKFGPNGEFLLKWGVSGAGDGEFNSPGGIALDSTNQIVYVSDTNNNRIEKFDLNGHYLGQWGNKGSSAGQFNGPNEITLVSGTVYVSDSLNGRIQVFSLAGNYITEINTSQEAQTSRPRGLAVDPSGWLLVSDPYTDLVEFFEPNPGNTTNPFTYAGSIGGWGTKDGNLNSPSGLAVDSNGNIYVADRYNQRISIFDGNGDFTKNWGASGQFCNPESLAINYDGNINDSNVYVADSLHNQIQESNLGGYEAKSWGTYGQGDGQFIYPRGIAANSKGQVYVADSINKRVEVFDSSGNFLFKFGNPNQTPSTANGQFSFPGGIAIDNSTNNVYVVDTANNNVQKFDLNGQFLAKWGNTTPGQPSTASGEFNDPEGIAVDPIGNVYVADCGNNRIEKFDSNGTFLTAWGSKGSGNSEFMGPYGIAVDLMGYVYVTDFSNNRVQKFTSAGSFVTAFGNYGHGAGQFSGPKGIAIDAKGYVYVADTFNQRIDRFSPANIDTNIVAPSSGARGWYNFTPSITLTASGNGPSYYRWDDDPTPQLYSGPITAKEGSHTLYAYSQDADGNIGLISNTVVKVDTIAPTGSISINHGAAKTNSSQIWTDVSTSPDVYDVKYSNEPSFTNSWENAYFSQQQGMSWNLSNGTGNKTVYIKMKDAAGNETTTSATIFVEQARLAGQSRIETATAISGQGWTAGTDVVVLVKDSDFPDALAGTPLAKKYDAPILLTNSQSLSPATDQEINRLKPKTVYILGGTGAVSTGIETSLKSRGINVIRIGGADRFETAALIAKQVGNQGKAVIAYGFNFPDALAVSSYAAYNGIPILFTDTNNLPTSSRNMLQELGVTQTIVVGGTGVISDKVTGQLPGMQRYSGADRYQTAIDIIRRLSQDEGRIYVATGENFPDALAGSALAARNNNPIVLIDPSLSAAATRQYLSDNKGTIQELYALGGTGVVSDTIMNKIHQLSFDS